MGAETLFSKCLIILHSAYNLIQCSIARKDLFQEESPLFMLFYQKWFIQLLNLVSPCEHRELIVTMLTQAAISIKNYHNPPLSSWLHIAFEVADLCFKVLDWNTSSIENPKLPPRYTASLSYILFIEELSNIILVKKNREEANAKRIQFFLTEIAKRFTNTMWELSAIKNELTKIYSILLVSKYWEPDDIQDECSQSLIQMIVRIFFILLH